MLPTCLQQTRQLWILERKQEVGNKQQFGYSSGPAIFLRTILPNCTYITLPNTLWVLTTNWQVLTNSSHNTTLKKKIKGLLPWFPALSHRRFARRWTAFCASPKPPMIYQIMLLCGTDCHKMFTQRRKSTHSNYFSNRNAQHFQYLIIKMYTTLCDTSSRDILQKSLQGKRKSSDFKYLYHFCPLTWV